jgi:SAM-dependent methyltransferase
VKHEPHGPDPREATAWPGWCCSYCAAPLEPRPHGLFCAAEGRYFATHEGVHRLLPDERRRELLAGEEQYQRVRRDEGWRGEPTLPAVPEGHPLAAVWAQRSARFEQAIGLLGDRLGQGPWRVLEVGAGCCWASIRLLERGHRVCATDVNMDAEDGLLAAERVDARGRDLPRAEADMEALPVEPGAFDLVLAAGALHHAQHFTRTLVELRRVTQRGGMLLVLDSPVYRRREDGEAMVAARMRDLSRRYGLPVGRESQSSYLVLGEIDALFRGAGWRAEVHGWPSLPAELGRDLVALARHRRRTARFPILLARRDG